MRPLLIVVVGVVWFAIGYAIDARMARVKIAGCGLLVLAAALFQASNMYGLSVQEVLLLQHRLPRFNATMIVDVPLVLGYGMFIGAALSIFFPVRSRSRTD
jgi:hypothetical protein